MARFRLERRRRVSCSKKNRGLFIGNCIYMGGMLYTGGFLCA